MDGNYATLLAFRKFVMGLSTRRGRLSFCLRSCFLVVLVLCLSIASINRLVRQFVARRTLLVSVDAAGGFAYGRENLFHVNKTENYIDAQNPSVNSFVYGIEEIVFLSAQDALEAVDAINDSPDHLTISVIECSSETNADQILNNLKTAMPNVSLYVSVRTGAQASFIQRTRD